MMFEIFTDGGYRMHKHIGAFAFIILRDGVIVSKESGIIIDSTSNRCEYIALINALIKLNELNLINLSNTVKIMSDSQLLINQVTGKWKVNDEVLKSLRLQVLKQGKLALGDTVAEFIWNPRESEWTVECDRMCNEVMDKVQR